MSVAYGPAFALLVAVTAAAFAHSYAALTPLIGSESPESLLLLVPFAAGLLLWRQLAHGGRDGGEISVNVFLATPGLIVLVALLLWFPARLSYFYWVYRLDLLAVPLFVASVVLLTFGFAAAWRARGGIAVLLLGWPPLLDSILRLVTDRVSSAQAAILGWLPLPGTRIGDSFFLGHGPHREAITVAAPCSGLLAVFSTLLVGGVVVAFREGARWRKAAWLGAGVALALVGNLVRLALVLVVAARNGVDAGFEVFHALAGPVVFAVTILCALQLLGLFGLRPGAQRAQPAARGIDLPFRTAAAIGGIVVVMALTALWSTSAVRTPGLFGDVVALDAADLLPLPHGYENTGVSSLASLGALFGAHAHAQLAHIDGLRGDAAAAQIVVTPSYRQAQRYNVLDCFVFHHAHVYSTHVVPLVEGGNAVLTAVRIDRRDIATLTWIQPVTVDGRRAWRRVLLFAYLDGVRAHTRAPHVDGAQSVGSWLLDRLGPYGATSPPARFHRVERGLALLADELVTTGSAASV